MLSILDILLLVLCAGYASAGPLRRLENTTSVDGSSTSLQQRSANAALTTQSNFNQPNTTFITSRTRLDSFISSRSAFSSGSTVSTFLATQLSPNASTSHPGTTILGSGAASFTGTTQSLNSNITATPNAGNSPSPTAANSNSPSAAPFAPPSNPRNGTSAQPNSTTLEGTTTTTLVVTRTIPRAFHANTSVALPRFSQRPGSSNGTRGFGGFRGNGSAPSSTLTSRPLDITPSHLIQPPPSTASFVLGSSTLEVTVSQIHAGAAAASSRVPVASESGTTTTTITFMSTVHQTITAIRHSQTSVANSSNNSPSVNGINSSARASTLTGSSSPLPTTFPHFSYDPTSASTQLPATTSTPNTALPPIVSATSSPTSTTSTPQQLSTPSSSPTTTLTSPTTAPPPPPPAPSASSPSTPPTSALQGITIVPINPEATTVTVTFTDAAATTTVAEGTVTVTVTAQGSGRPWWHGD
ncbi:hypothetical protein BDY17DRAFT_288345 [Neohortaea acidophila]|uniref:REJ domain-containing protein n=1 Tax=Neohortaea acidophila TaxID=245834 RepID=A0A6A6Q3S9_9PEZI|nr:uncharacterized protein BDY17DRAFT_288345 [Neohortaea acidophila]KAF2487108.1 hypothetical protein BDY17DRAFT_288345 [Neohortaea acidophila]